jgi:hypothetical protein
MGAGKLTSAHTPRGLKTGRIAGKIAIFADCSRRKLDWRRPSQSCTPNATKVERMTEFYRKRPECDGFRPYSSFGYPIRASLSEENLGGGVQSLCRRLTLVDYLLTYTTSFRNAVPRKSQEMVHPLPGRTSAFKDNLKV